MNNWYEKLRGRVPESPIVRELIEAVESLPGINKWAPKYGIENHWSDLITWGFALCGAQRFEGTDLLHKKIADEIIQSDKPIPDTFAELSAAGLCLGLGAYSGSKIPESKNKTADWRMIWPEMIYVDVEVTVARKKENHLQRQSLATELANSLIKVNHDFDLIIHLTDISNVNDREDICNFSQEIECGQTKEVPGRWHLKAQEITREQTVLYTVGDEPRPRWWSETNARCFVLHSMLAGPDTLRAPPQVRVYYGVPYDSYINPIKRKAELPQGEVGFPFLVAVDIRNLPDAFREMPLALSGYLQFWQEVSGILLFENVTHFDRIGWQWKLIKNPYANVPLPDSLLSTRADLSETMETGIKLILDNEESKSKLKTTG